MLEYFRVQKDKLKDARHILPLWNYLEPTLEVSSNVSENNDYEIEKVSSKTLQIVLNSHITGELYLRTFGDTKYIVCQFGDEEIWFDVDTLETRAPSSWKYGEDFYIRKKKPKTSIRNCLSHEEAVLLYNQGVALYNAISKDYAFKYANKHYVSKDIARNNQHTFKKQIWKISRLTVQDNLIELLEKSKKVILTQSNHNVGIVGKFTKHVNGQKSLKNQIKGEFKLVKHFIHNVLHHFKK